MDLDHALTTTRAVRRRLDLGRPVERAVVEECLRLALQAPNGSNTQLWRWVLVDDPAVRTATAEIYRAALDEYASSGFTQAGLVPVAYTIGDEFTPAVRRPVAEVACWNRFGR